MKKTMKSRASLKFLSSHPEQYKMFKDVLQSVKQKTSKLVLQKIENHKNHDLYRMVNNQPNLIFPMEEKVFEKELKHLHSPKKVSWSKTLFEVQIIRDVYD